MKVDIIEAAITFDIYGFSATAVGMDYAGTAFRLMDKMWMAVKGNGLPNKGINIWVYEPEDRVFAGVELHGPPDPAIGLEHKVVHLIKYGYSKHVGPYHLLKHAGQNMHAELKQRGFKTTFPYVERYGHWSSDESKLETELFVDLK
jgi:hypothetical protein